jgi:hypothetical protein
MAVTHEAISGISQVNLNEVSCDERTPLSVVASLDLDSSPEQSEQPDHKKTDRLLNPWRTSSPVAFLDHHRQTSAENSGISQVWSNVLLQPGSLFKPIVSMNTKDEDDWGSSLNRPELGVPTTNAVRSTNDKVRDDKL